MMWDSVSYVSPNVPLTSLVSIDSNFCLKQLLLLWWLPNGGFKKSAHICKLEIYYKEKCTFLLSICLTIIHSFICSSIHLYYYRLISYLYSMGYPLLYYSDTQTLPYLISRVSLQVGS